jgi:hypothetical protein
VPKRIHIKTLFYKSLLVAVFGAFFFVQAQSEFIYCAYNNDFASRGSANAVSAHRDGTNIAKDKSASDSHTNIKLNKRYQVVTPHALVPAVVSMPVYFTVLCKKWYIPSLLSHAYFLYCKPLRGPPTV